MVCVRNNFQVPGRVLFTSISELQKVSSTVAKLLENEVARFGVQNQHCKNELKTKAPVLDGFMSGSYCITIGLVSSPGNSSPWDCTSVVGCNHSNASKDCNAEEGGYTLVILIIRPSVG